jgi:hypothetical protein
VRFSPPPTERQKRQPSVFEHNFKNLPFQKFYSKMMLKKVSVVVALAHSTSAFAPAPAVVFYWLLL